MLCFQEEKAFSLARMDSDAMHAAARLADKK
jgi:hypothetical protein